MTTRHAIFLELVLMFSASVLATDIGLPMIQINHDDDDDYPNLQEQVHLEDFFWTGSGDGPPEYVKKIHTGISKGKDVIVKTNTLVATVYVEGHNEIDIPICLDCFPDNGVGLPLNVSATDRRYWLLTVISGFYSGKDIPMLEEKLAKLYRLAFTRQQTKHLGIGNGLTAAGASISAQNPQQPDLMDDTMERDITDDSDDMDVDDDTDMDTTDYHEMKRHRRRRRKKRKRRQLPTENYPESQQNWSFPTSDPLSAEINESLERNIYENLDSSAVTDETTELPQQAYELLNPPTNNDTKEDLHLEAVSNKNREAVNLPPGFNPQAIFTDDQVRIVIHNVTQITEDDIQSGVLPSVTRSDGNDVNEKIDERPLANQTEIIYSVFVSGRPVLAVTAANDMKLVSEEEVASVMGKEIYMKAEPYLREPLATPLAPATRSGDSSFIATIGNNPLLVIIGSLVILLLLLLLIALFLMGRQKKTTNSDVKRASSRNELLAQGASSPQHEREHTRETGGAATITRIDINEGIHNYAYERDTMRHGAPPPHPPATRSRRGSTTSSDNTSDSSIYSPINPTTADAQRVLDEKAATLFEKPKRRQQHYNNAESQEATYASVISERKKDHKHSSSSGKHKTKRRYLSENRVGSIEEVPTHSSIDTTASNESIVEALQPSYENVERTEAFNPHNNYHRNKLLHNRVFTDKMYDSVPDEMPTQAINREIIRALQPSEKSSETGSIGSFLSMASVKSFPKHSLPEPLNRVLEPVFVTYYDNLDEVPQKSSRKSRPKSPLTEAIASIERFPEPKAPKPTNHRTASQSDNPDPGVVGPIVWELHKKRMSSENDVQDYVYDPTQLSPIRDPAEMRNHFQGLLEGAIQMYSSQDDLPTPLPTKNFTNKRKQTSRENRGRSAGSMDQPRNSTGSRPSTAQPEKSSQSNHSTQPPSPNMGAWGSGGVHQPLVRPLSAGPFHRPDPPPRIDVTRVRASQSANREDLSAAPLIEAIQNELRKFKRDS